MISTLSRMQQQYQQQRIKLLSNRILLSLMVIAWCFTSNFQLSIAVTSAAEKNINGSSSNTYIQLHNSNDNKNHLNIIRKDKMFIKRNVHIGNGDGSDIKRLQKRDYYTSNNPYGGIGGSTSGGGGVSNIGNVIYDGNLNIHNWHHNYGIGRRTSGMTAAIANHMGHNGVGIGFGGMHNSKTSTTSSSSSSSASSSAADGGGGGGDGGNGSGGNGGSSGNTAGTNSASTAAAGGGEVMLPKSSFPLSAQEPTCEQLRAMWIFSKRQSRAAEMTNEIPTYRDPFAYNVWEPYYSTTRSMGAIRMLPRYMERTRLPVFGRVISQEPLLSTFETQQRRLAAEGRSGGSSSYRIYNTGLRRPVGTQYRYIGGSNSGGGSIQTHSNSGHSISNVGGGGIGSGNNNGNDNSDGGKQQNAAVQGSFQKLKELIWTERAKDLTQQRRAEEIAARAAVLKEIANGQNIQPPISSYKQHLYGKMESAFADENRAPDMEVSGGAFQHDGRYTGSNGSGGDGGDGSSDFAATHTAQKYAQHQQQPQHGKLSHLHRSYGNGKMSTTVTTTNSKSPIFNPGIGRLLMPSSINLNGYETSNGGSSGGSVDAIDFNTGIPKVYPMRGTHFRERNNMLYKQQQQQQHQQQQLTPNVEYFQRNVRNQKVWPMSAEAAIELPALQQKQQRYMFYIRPQMVMDRPQELRLKNLHNNNNNKISNDRAFEYKNDDWPFIIDYEKFLSLNNDGIWKLKSSSDNDATITVDNADTGVVADAFTTTIDGNNNDGNHGNDGSFDGADDMNIVNDNEMIDRGDNVENDDLEGKLDMNNNDDGDNGADYKDADEEHMKFELNLPIRYNNAGFSNKFVV